MPGNPAGWSSSVVNSGSTPARWLPANQTFSKKMKTRPTNTIPTDAEFEAASKSMATRIRSEESIKARIAAVCSLSPIYHDAYVWLPNGKCHVDLFVRHDAELVGEEAQGLREMIIELLTPAIEPEREISVDLDSHERILREFNGNYFNCFR